MENNMANMKFFNHLKNPMQVF